MGARSDHRNAASLVRQSSLNDVRACVVPIVASIDQKIQSDASPVSEGRPPMGACGSIWIDCFRLRGRSPTFGLRARRWACTASKVAWSISGGTATAITSLTGFSSLDLPRLLNSWRPI